MTALGFLDDAYYHCKEHGTITLCVSCAEKAFTAAIAEEAAKRTCVYHSKTLCACYTCIRDFKVEAMREERERIVKKIEDNANDGCLCCENTAAAIRKGVKA